MSRPAKALLGVLAVSGLLGCAKPTDRAEEPARPVAQSEPSESPDAAPPDSQQEELAAAAALRRAQEAEQNAAARAEDEEKQRQTVRTIDTLGTAIGRWLSAATTPGGIHGPPDFGNPVHNVDDYPLISHNELVGMLVPQYIASVPSTDAWGNPLEVRVRTSDFVTHRLFMIRSPGRDGAFSSDTYTHGTFGARDFDEDIVFADSFFVRWPESIKLYE